MLLELSRQEAEVLVDALEMKRRFLGFGYGHTQQQMAELALKLHGFIVECERRDQEPEGIAEGDPIPGKSAGNYKDVTGW